MERSRQELEQEKIWDNEWRSAPRKVGLEFRPWYDRSLRAMALKTPAKCLDIGCGSGEYSIHFAKQGATVVALDLSFESLLLVKERCKAFNIANVHLVKASATSLPFHSRSFDLTLSDGALQYIQNHELACCEMVRVSTFNGTIVINVPNALNLIFLLSVKLAGTRWRYGKERLYTRVQLLSLMRKVGIQALTVRGFYPSYAIQRLYSIHRLFWIIGKIFERIFDWIDSVTKYWVSNNFGFYLSAKGTVEGE